MRWGWRRRDSKREGFRKRWLRRADDCSSSCASPACPCDFLLLGKLLALMALRTPNVAPRSKVSASARTGLLLIRGYQRALSPLLPSRCRQVPTCSRYGYQAVSRYGLITGSRLTAGRIARCTRAVPPGTQDPLP